MMPILQASGVRHSRGSWARSAWTFEPDSERFTLTMSATGMPSVMQTISGTSASMASRMESAAKAGGT
jgi:hypothetical protein